MRSLKNWRPKSPLEIEAMRGQGSGLTYQARMTQEFEKACMFHNGWAWAKGQHNSHTIKGQKSVYWKLGFWRAGGRNPPLKYRQQQMQIDD